MRQIDLLCAKSVRRPGTMKNFSYIRIIRLLIIACACLFAGRAFQHLFQDIPIRILLWDQLLMESVVNLFGITWDEYIQNPQWDQRIQLLIKTFGAIYLACLVFVIFLWSSSPNVTRYHFVLLAGSILLFLLSLVYFMDKFFRLGELLEYTCQWISPLLLYLLLEKRINEEHAVWAMRLAIVFTFSGHGLYAVGFYPTPGNFIDMIIMSFGVSQSTAETMLTTAGWLDFILSALILLPYTYRYAALYAFVWGALTALARIWANYDVDFSGQSFYQWLPEVLVRVPNAIVPLCVYLYRPHTAIKPS
jgi:hypothetical protein